MTTDIATMIDDTLADLDRADAARITARRIAIIAQALWCDLLRERGGTGPVVTLAKQVECNQKVTVNLCSR